MPVATPAHQGYLYLNYPATSRHDWVERWCSLEHDSLLMYANRNTAIAQPEQVCFAIDLAPYSHVETSIIDNSSGPWELIMLSTLASRVSPPTPSSHQKSSAAVTQPKMSVPNSPSSWSKFGLTSRRQKSAVGLADSLAIEADSHTRTVPPLRLRASSADALATWVDRLSTAIETKNRMSIPKGSRRDSRRSSLGSILGFRATTDVANLTGSCVNDVISAGEQPSLLDSLFERSVPMAKLASSSSKTSLRRKNKCAHQSIDLGQVVYSTHQREFAPPTTAASFSSVFTAKTAVDRTDFKQRQRQSKHSRSGSVASFVSSFTPKRSLSKRRASTSLLDDTTPDNTATLPPSFTPHTADSASFDRIQPDRSSTSNTLSDTRHQQSRTGFRHGSAKVLAWMDGAMPVTPGSGLGLDFEIKQEVLADSKHGTVPDSLLTKLKSFGMRPTFRRGWSETLVPSTTSIETEGSLYPVNASRGGIDQSPGLSRLPINTKSMSRASSFLNLSMIGFPSQRDRSISRQSSAASFLATSVSLDEPRTPSLNLRPFHSELQGCNVSGLGDMTDSIIFKTPLLPASAFVSSTDADSSIVYTERAATTKKSARHNKNTPSAVDRLGLFKRHAAPSTRETAKEILSLDESTTLSQDLTGSLSPSSSPPVSPVLVQRILPPEQIIDTFDRLRIVDPSGRARDVLGATGKSPLLDEDHLAPQRCSSGDSSTIRDPWQSASKANLTWEVPLSWNSNYSSPTLASENLSTSQAGGWGSTPSQQLRIPLLKGNSLDNQSNTWSGRVDDFSPNPRLRSLPAPPRKAKRRPQTSSGVSSVGKQPEQHVFKKSAANHSTSLSPLSDISNQVRATSFDRSA